MNQYQIFELLIDLNPVIKKGMKGVILEIWNNESFEAEFVDDEDLIIPITVTRLFL